MHFSSPLSVQMLLPLEKCTAFTNPAEFAHYFVILSILMSLE